MSSLKKNIFYNFSYQFLIMFLPFITAPYLSRVLGAEAIGVYTYSYSIATYFIYLSMLGVNTYGNRAIAIVRDNKEKLSRTFWEIYEMQLISTIVLLILYMIYAWFWASNRIAAITQGIYIMSSLFDINWFFFGNEEFKITVIRNSIVKIFTVIFIFIFVRNESDLYVYCLIMSLSILISQIVLWPFLKNRIEIRLVNIMSIKKHIVPNFMFFIPVISVSIYKIMDKIMLGYLVDVKSVAYYEYAEKVINIPIALITAIGAVMLPRMTSLISKNKKEESRMYIDQTMIYVLAFSNAVFFGLLAISDNFVNLYYGSNFVETGSIIKYLSITIIFLGFGNVLRTQYLIPNKRDKIYIISAILGAIINFIVNSILIPKFGAVGAAIGTILAELSVCGYQIFCVKNELNIKEYFRSGIIYFLSGLIMYFIIKIIPEINNNWIELIVDIIVGIISYSILFIFTTKKILHYKLPYEKNLVIRYRRK